MKKPKKAPAADPKVQGKEVLVNVVLDRSGSMGSCRAGTISGYNEYLQGLRADKDTQYSVSLIQFDSPNDGPELTVSYADKPLADVVALAEKDYEPRGMTPLYDAIGECVRRVYAKGRAVITVIITDGHENASREFSRGSVKDLIKAKESEGWSFVFLGANIDSAQVGGSLGVATANCANYAVGNEAAVYQTLAASAQRYSSAVRSYGMKSLQAKSSAAPTHQERSAMLGHSPAFSGNQIPGWMLGGRPAAPPTFPPAKPKQRGWAVKQQ